MTPQKATPRSCNPEAVQIHKVLDSRSLPPPGSRVKEAQPDNPYRVLLYVGRAGDMSDAIREQIRQAVGL